MFGSSRDFKHAKMSFDAKQKMQKAISENKRPEYKMPVLACPACESTQTEDDVLSEMSVCLDCNHTWKP